MRVGVRVSIPGLPLALLHLLGNLARMLAPRVLVRVRVRVRVSVRVSVSVRVRVRVRVS